MGVWGPVILDFIPCAPNSIRIWRRIGEFDAIWGIYKPCSAQTSHWYCVADTSNICKVSIYPMCAWWVWRASVPWFSSVRAQFNLNLTHNWGIWRNLGDVQPLSSPDEPLMLCSGHIKHLHSKYQLSVCLMGLVWASVPCFSSVRAQFNSNLMHSNCGI